MTDYSREYLNLTGQDHIHRHETGDIVSIVEFPSRLHEQTHIGQLPETYIRNMLDENDTMGVVNDSQWLCRPA